LYANDKKNTFLNLYENSWNFWDRPCSYLQYYDVNNNLYSWGMQQHFPYCGFKWVDPDTMPKDFWRVVDLMKDEYSCIL